MEQPASAGSRHRACEPCRKRKIKCSQQKPLCKRCDKKGLECEYSTIKTMGRPKTKRSAGSKTIWTETETSDHTMTMGTLPDGFDQSFPDFGPLLPFDATLHSMSTWPNLLDTQLTLGPTSEAFHDTVASPNLGMPMGTNSPWSSAPQQQRQMPSSGNRCTCVEMVHRHFSLTDDNDHTFEKTLPLLQSSTKSASDILNCSACFDPKNSVYGLSKNIHLLGSLMSSIASTYAGFLTYQQRVAKEASEKEERIAMRIGQDTGGVIFRLSGEEYWSLLKTTIGSEINYLMELCTSFADRQMKEHSRGHEVCESGQPCHKDEEEEEAVQDDKCPSNIDVAKRYSCFRTVEQVRAAIDEARKIIKSNKFSAVVGQQCL